LNPLEQRSTVHVRETYRVPPNVLILDSFQLLDHLLSPWAIQSSGSLLHDSLIGVWSSKTFSSAAVHPGHRLYVRRWWLILMVDFVPTYQKLRSKQKSELSTDSTINYVSSMRQEYTDSSIGWRIVSSYTSP
jgi:hypothetical protein